MTEPKFIRPRSVVTQSTITPEPARTAAPPTPNWVPEAGQDVRVRTRTYLVGPVEKQKPNMPRATIASAAPAQGDLLPPPQKEFFWHSRSIYAQRLAQLIDRVNMMP